MNSPYPVWSIVVMSIFCFYLEKWSLIPNLLLHVGLEPCMQNPASCLFIHCWSQQHVTKAKFWASSQLMLIERHSKICVPRATKECQIFSNFLRSCRALVWCPPWKTNHRSGIPRLVIIKIMKAWPNSEWILSDQCKFVNSLSWVVLKVETDWM